MHIEPYLFFNGRCDEAIEFYRSALGAEVLMLMRFKDSPEPPPPDAAGTNNGDKVMHAAVRIGATTVMVSDGQCDGATGAAEFRGFSLSITADDDAHAQRLFAALAEGGQVRVPLAPTFFSPQFGMVVDRFGVGWMVVVATPA